jgi:hypothetical protein
VGVALLHACILAGPGLFLCLEAPGNGRARTIFRAVAEEECLAGARDNIDGRMADRADEPRLAEINRVASRILPLRKLSTCVIWGASTTGVGASGSMVTFRQARIGTSVAELSPPGLPDGFA